jgi:hypothetical protein
MTKPGTNQHQGGISTQKSTDDPRSPPDLTIHPLNYIIGTDLRPVFRRIITVGQRFFNASLHFLGGLRQLISFSSAFFHTAFAAALQIVIKIAAESASFLCRIF